jgi:hypothetical protein
MVKPVDKLRDQTVRAVMEKTFAARGALARFKAEAWGDVQDFLALSAEEHNAFYGGGRGNVRLATYDGHYMLQIAVNDAMRFNEKLQAAKTLVDRCVRRWADGSRPEIKLLVEDAFCVDKQGASTRAASSACAASPSTTRSGGRPWRPSRTASRWLPARPTCGFTSVKRMAATSKSPLT